MSIKTARAYWPPTDRVSLADVAKSCISVLLEKMANDEILNASFEVKVKKQHNIPSPKPVRENSPEYEDWVFNNVKEVGTRLVEVTATIK